MKSSLKRDTRAQKRFSVSCGDARTRATSPSLVGFITIITSFSHRNTVIRHESRFNGEFLPRISRLSEILYSCFPISACNSLFRARRRFAVYAPFFLSLEKCIFCVIAPRRNALRHLHVYRMAGPWRAISRGDEEREGEREKAIMHACACALRDQSVAKTRVTDKQLLPGYKTT